MFSIHEHLRRIAGLEKKYRLEGIKIFFKAPSPRKQSSRPTPEKLNVTQSNFQWLSYQVLFSVDVGEDTRKYYIYSVYLESTGKEKLPNKVFESDSAWSGKNKNMQTRDCTPGEIKNAFKEVLDPPRIHKTSEFATTLYVNTDPSDGNGPEAEYSDKDFEKFFDDDKIPYVVMDAHGSDLKNPMGRVVGEVQPQGMK